MSRPASAAASRSFPAVSAIDIGAVADPVQARRQLARRMIPGVRTYASHGELLDAEAELDFVDIATPVWSWGLLIVLAVALVFGLVVAMAVGWLMWVSQPPMEKAAIRASSFSRAAAY